MRTMLMVSEGSDVDIVAVFTDSLKAASNPVSVIYTAYRDSEATPAQEVLVATVTDNTAALTIAGANVKVGNGKEVSTYLVEVSATMSGAKAVTSTYQFRVRNLRSIT